MKGNDLVDLSDYRFVIEPRYFALGWTDCRIIMGRRSAVQALVKARTCLPPGWNFKVWDMHRTREVQVAMIKSFRERIRSKHPDWTDRAVMREVYNFAAKAKHKVRRPDCHRNGGAVDLTIVDECGREIDMGTSHDDLTEKARFDYFETLMNPSDHDRVIAANRGVLKRVMEVGGYEGLPGEWWHWSTHA